jgi:hypothetical protein
MCSCEIFIRTEHRFTEIYIWFKCVASFGRYVCKNLRNTVRCHYGQLGHADNMTVLAVDKRIFIPEEIESRPPSL